MIRVLVVDDQAIVREGLISMLSPEPDITVVGQAQDGDEALERAIALTPDIVLMDVRMPHTDGLTALFEIKRSLPACAVIMVTLYDDPSYLMRAVANGAAGYVLKDSSRGELLRAVRTTAEGGAIIDSTMLPSLLNQVSDMLASGHICRDPSPTTQPLTPRESEVLALVAEGLTNTMIGERLVISPTTVKSHVQSILHKMDVSDRTQAAVLAVRRGLV